MAKLTSIEISLEYDESGDYQHDGYYDSPEEAIAALSKLIFNKLPAEERPQQFSQEYIYRRLEAIEDEMKDPHISWYRTCSLLNEKEELYAALEH